MFLPLCIGQMCADKQGGMTAAQADTYTLALVLSLSNANASHLIFLAAKLQDHVYIIAHCPNRHDH